MDYSNHEDVIAALKAAQDADEDLRDNAREAHLFVDKRDGQWEPYWWNQNSNKPRYTFDMTNAIVDQITSEITKRDFDIKIRPGDGATADEDAKLFDGLVRAIENLSEAQHIYNHAARNMVTAGLDGWQIAQEYVDSDCFDQDLVIKPVFNFLDSVWFDQNARRQDKADARHAWLLEAMARDVYEERWPDREPMSVGQGRMANAYYDKSDQIIVGQFYWVTEEKRTLVKTSAGRVFDEMDPDFIMVRDELEAAGEVVVATRTRKRRVIKTRLFDAGGWLTDAQKTVFSYIPLIPTYGNFKVFENKTLFRGAVEKLLDPQRVYNYAKSREIEEGALAPRPKYWMTRKQAQGYEQTLRTLNTNADPVQFYNPDPETGSGGPPQQQGGAAINPGLQAVSESMRMILGQVAGMFAANMGDNPGLQSGVAIEKLQAKGDAGADKYISSLEIAISHTARILVDAIPRVYDDQRMMFILGEDGSLEQKVVNQTVVDMQTGRMVKLNDLSRGKYSVVCKAGPSFNSRQAETVSALVEIAGVDPTIIELGGDVLFSNMSAPGMDLIAARKRRRLFEQGMIPFEQMTQEEMQEYQQKQQQPPPPDPAMILAQAEQEKAQAQTANVQAKTQATILDMTLRQQKDQRDDQMSAAKLSLEARRLQMDESRSELQQMRDMMALQLQQQQQVIQAIKTQAESLRTLREAMGADAIMDPAAAAAYHEQAEQVLDSQDTVRSGTPAITRGGTL